MGTIMSYKRNETKEFDYEEFKRDVDSLKGKLDEYRTSEVHISEKKIKKVREFIQMTEDRIDNLVEFIPYLEKHFEEQGYKSYVRDEIEYHDSDIKFDPNDVLSTLNHRLSSLQNQVKQREIQIVNTRSSLGGMKKKGYKNGEYQNWYCQDTNNVPFKISIHMSGDFEWKDKFMNGYTNYVNELKDFIRDKRDKLLEMN